MAEVDIFPAAPLLRSRANSDLPVGVQEHVRSSFWPGSMTSLSEFSSFFRNFQWTLNVVVWPNVGTADLPLVVKKYQDLAAIIRCLEEHRDEPRDAIVARLQSIFPQSSQDHITRSVDLAVGLWMSLNVRARDAPVGPWLSDVTTVEWTQKQSLRNLVEDTFPKCAISLAPTLSTLYDRAHIDPAFNVMALQKICRVNVKWTSNLKDHLRFDHSRRTVHIYPHKVCLLNHFEWCNVYPRDLLLETIQTLDLLFPYGDNSTERYLEESNQPFYRTSSSFTQACPSSLAEFCYWRQRLMELDRVFREPPTSVDRLWYDRRNPMQWYTFWLAVLIAILSVVFGSLGTYIGFKQIELAERSIQISLSQLG